MEISSIKHSSDQRLSPELQFSHAFSQTSNSPYTPQGVKGESLQSNATKLQDISSQDFYNQGEYYFSKYYTTQYTVLRGGAPLSCICKQAWLFSIPATIDWLIDWLIDSLWTTCVSGNHYGSLDHSRHRPPRSISAWTCKSCTQKHIHDQTTQWTIQPTLWPTNT